MTHTHKVLHTPAPALRTRNPSGLQEPPYAWISHKREGFLGVSRNKTIVVTNFIRYTDYCEFLLHHVEHMAMFLKPFSHNHLYIKSHQVRETNKRTVVVVFVVGRVYRQNSSRSIKESCNWKDCTQEVEKIPVKEIMMMRRGCWLLVEEVEKIPSKEMMMMVMKGLLLLEEKPHWSQWFLLGKTIGCLRKSPWEQQ